MKIIVIQKDHNSSACLYDDKTLVYYNQEERLSRIKKDAGIPFYCLQEIVKLCHRPDIVIITGYDHYFYQNGGIIALMKKIGFEFGPKFKVVEYNKGHHFAHAAKAFYDSGFQEALVYVSDGKGASYNLTNGRQAWETTSVYLASYPNKFELVYKRLHTYSKFDQDTKVVWDNSLGISKEPLPRWYNAEAEIELRNDFDVGFMYEGVSRAVGFDDEGGKMLGLSAYGKYDNDLPTVMDENFVFNMGLFEFDQYDKYRTFNTSKYPYLFDDQDKKTNLTYMTQKFFEFSSCERIKKFLDKTGAKNLIITGGTALNVVGNYYFRQQIDADINIYVEPMCGDEGNCLGLAKFYMQDRFYNFKPEPQKDIYICGHSPVYDFNLNDGEQVFENVDTRVPVELLRAGHIVALYQGKAEAGPRALGNRSILFDPRVKNGKELVNLVKRREHFRPFAATVLYEQVHNWFDMAGIDESPYMMYAVQAKDGVKEKVPSVIHVDNTCRVQTLKEEQNPAFYKIIKLFYEKTGIPMLFNTSFNLAGEPIVETVKEAIECLRNSEIEYLYLPDVKKLIYIKN